MAPGTRQQPFNQSSKVGWDTQNFPYKLQHVEHSAEKEVTHCTYRIPWLTCRDTGSSRGLHACCCGTARGERADSSSMSALATSRDGAVPIVLDCGTCMLFTCDKTPFISRTAWPDQDTWDGLGVSDNTPLIGLRTSSHRNYMHRT